MTFSSTQVLLACHDCNVLLPVLAASSQLPVDDEAADAYATFAADHAAHYTALLRRHGGECIADHPLWDPMARITFEATDGNQLYIVTAARVSIEEPRVYHFMRGALQVQHAEVDIDDGDLRRALDREFFPFALRPTKVERFLSILHEVLSRIDPNGLEPSFDLADDPDISIAVMPEGSYRELLARCAEVFDPSELPLVNRFLEDNRDADGLLALRLRRSVVALSA
jgi:hypothetical protein